MMTGGALAQTAPPPDLPFADFQVTPRFWDASRSFGPTIRKESPLNTIVFNGEEYALGGAAFSARLNALPETTLVASVLGGTNGPQPLNESFSSPGFLSSATTHTQRFDIEFLAQTAIPQTEAAWIIGGRVEREDTSTRQTTVLPAGFGPIVSSSGGTSYTAKAGIAGALPLTPDGNLRMFGNALVAAGASVSDSNGPGSAIGIVGPEGAIGLQYAIAPNINVDVRYRVIVYYLFGVPTSLEQSTPQYVVQHGPMIGLNIKF
jgi:hypothetical protein